MLSKIKITHILGVIIAILSIIIIFLLADTSNKPAVSQSEPTPVSKTCEGIGVGPCLSTDKSVTIHGGSDTPKPKEVIISGGECVGLCIEDESIPFPSYTTGIVGIWTEPDNSKTFVTSYTPCSDIISEGITSKEAADRIDSIRYICDKYDRVVLFNGDNDTYRIPTSMDTGKMRIEWSDAMPLPKIHSTEASGGTLK